MSMTLEDNILMSVSTLTRFILTAKFEHLDGFVFEIPDQDGTYGGSPVILGRTVRRVLKTLSDQDPAKEFCMDSDIDSISWQFRFNYQRIFVTSYDFSFFGVTLLGLPRAIPKRAPDTHSGTRIIATFYFNRSLVLVTMKCYRQAILTPFGTRFAAISPNMEGPSTYQNGQACGGCDSLETYTIYRQNVSHLRAPNSRNWRGACNVVAPRRH